MQYADGLPNKITNFGYNFVKYFYWIKEVYSCALFSYIQNFMLKIIYSETVPPIPMA